MRLDHFVKDQGRLGFQSLGHLGLGALLGFGLESLGFKVWSSGWFAVDPAHAVGY